MPLFVIEKIEKSFSNQQYQCFISGNILFFPIEKITDFPICPFSHLSILAHLRTEAQPLPASPAHLGGHPAAQVGLPRRALRGAQRAAAVPQRATAVADPAEEGFFVKGEEKGGDMLKFFMMVKS